MQFYRPSATSAARSTNEGWLGFRRTFFIESINSRLWVFTLFAIQLLPNCYCYCYVTVTVEKRLLPAILVIESIELKCRC